MRVSRQGDDASRDGGSGELLKGSRWPVPSIVPLSGSESPQHKECGTSHRYQPLPFWDKVGHRAGSTTAASLCRSIVGPGTGTCNPLGGRLDNCSFQFYDSFLFFCFGLRVHRVEPGLTTSGGGGAYQKL